MLDPGIGLRLIKMNPFQVLAYSIPAYDADGFYSVFDFQFSEDVVDVGFDCAFGQEQHLGNVFVAFALADELRDLPLPPR